MQESYSEGLAIHTDPESCGYVGNDMSEALTGLPHFGIMSITSSDSKRNILTSSVKALLELMVRHGKNMARILKIISRGFPANCKMVHTEPSQSSGFLYQNPMGASVLSESRP